jgi:hypothetical protein
MDELIFKQVLLAEYDKHHIGLPGGARKLIEEAPAVDAVPVVHGWWIEVSDGRCMCSRCNTVIRHGIGYYCLNCGTKMDAW